MKFKFKIQGYQTEAVDNTTAIFSRQPNRNSSKYRRDLGKRDSGIIRLDGEDDGYRTSIATRDDVPQLPSPPSLTRRLIDAWLSRSL